MGCVSPVAGQGADIARTAAITAGYSETAAGVTINRFCASGLEAVNMAAAKVMSGMADMTIGGGWDEGRFEKSIVPVKDQLGVTILAQDEHMRPQTDMQSLGSLNPAFESLGKVMPGMDFVAMQKYPELERPKR